MTPQFITLDFKVKIIYYKYINIKRKGLSMIRNFYISERQIINFIVLTTVCLLAYLVSMSFLNKFLMRSKINANFHSFIKSITKISLLIFLFFLILSAVFNVNISTFLAAFSVAGLAVSLAVKDSLANIASGFLLLICKPFQKGDFIEINKVSGTILEVSLIYTTMSTIDNKIIYMPNAEASKDIIINYTGQKHRRLDITFSIEYTEDIDRVKTIIKNCVVSSAYYNKDIEPVQIVVSDLSANSVDILCQSWCDSTNYLSYKYYLNEIIKKEFDKNNIVIPFSQLDVNIKR